MHRKQLIFNESTSQTELPTFTMFAFSDTRKKEGGRERDEQRQHRPRERERDEQRHKRPIERKKEMNKDKRDRERKKEMNKDK